METGKLKDLSVFVGVTLLVVALLLSSGCASTPAPAPTNAPAAPTAAAPAPAAPTAAPAAPTTAPAAPTAAPAAPTAAPTGGKNPITGRDHILVGLVRPVTGPLGFTSIGQPWTEQRVVDYINKQGGVLVDGVKLPIKLITVDTQSEQTKVSEVTVKLIQQDKVDIVYPAHAPETVAPASAACERYQVPCVGMNAPIDAWLLGGPYKWSTLAHFLTPHTIDTYIAMWEAAAKKDPSVKKIVGGMFPNDADGKAWAQGFKDVLPKRGYKLIDPGFYPPMTKDYTSIINQFKAEGVDIIVGPNIPPDIAVILRQMKQQSYAPKVITFAKGALVPDAIEAIGNGLGAGMLTENWWNPKFPYKSALTGETAQQFGDAFTAEFKQQWRQMPGYCYGGMEVIVDMLKRAGTLDKAKLRDAMMATDLDTIMGHVKYTKEGYADMPIAGGQWVKGKTYPFELEIVDNTVYPFINKSAEIQVPFAW